LRFYQASSSEIFGEPREVPQTEGTPLAPVTPYGVAKAYAHFSARSYRQRYGLFACSGILYNHESPRRPLEFLPRKVAHGAWAIQPGRERGSGGNRRSISHGSCTCSSTPTYAGFVPAKPRLAWSGDETTVHRRDRDQRRRTVLRHRRDRPQPSGRRRAGEAADRGGEGVRRQRSQDAETVEPRAVHERVLRAAVRQRAQLRTHLRRAPRGARARHR